ncbi:MAG: hypothetical protein M1469_12720 [Bacteroidetes bacterium]|nr:hypothetical protein [Bacteroidota bacterium]
MSKLKTGADIMAVDATKRKRPNGAPKSLAINRNYQTPFKPTKQIEYSFPSKIRIVYSPNVPPQSSGTGRIPN